MERDKIPAEGHGGDVIAAAGASREITGDRSTARRGTFLLERGQDDDGGEGRGDRIENGQGAGGSVELGTNLNPPAVRYISDAREDPEVQNHRVLEHSC
ncbi:Hypothetical protein NTJ_13392 [Nesidiocoris tenuis]|uniref:Uncharacterized protein n=1 Tax=Nesidiocoris tenuis TaxID=355587 RepID=A0ABN7BBL4_9HEMI|nr:Hypothetical protein NTJ_13392 [Nesidiocoris tenuis]